MNTYIITSFLDDFGSVNETVVKADYFHTLNGELHFVQIVTTETTHTKDTKYETVASFANGMWSCVTKDTPVE